MDGQQPSDPKRETVDFLRAEYRYLGECFWRNEETGERRVNFLITLSTAIVAGLVTLATSQYNHLSDNEMQLVIVVVLLSLLLIGLVTLLRMIRRNQVADTYKRGMDMIRSHFRQWDQQHLQDYYPLGKKKGRDTVAKRRPGTGGLVDLVSLLNSLLLAALCAVVAHLSSGEVYVIGLSGLAGFILGWMAQSMYVKYRYATEEKWDRARAYRRR